MTYKTNEIKEQHILVNKTQENLTAMALPRINSKKCLWKGDK